MSSQSEYPAAWMDQFADWLGSCVPGCANLPARHPVKVSLVMGVFGWLTGWIIIAPIFAVEVLLPPFTVPGIQFFISLLATCWSGIFIIIPHRLWSGKGLVNSLWVIPVATVTHWIAAFFAALIMINSEPENVVISICMTLLIITTVHVWLTVGQYSDGMGFWLTSAICTTVVTGTAIGLAYAIWNLAEQGRRSDDWLMMSCISLPVMAYYITLAICLGSNLWDHTPRPKFCAGGIHRGGRTPRLPG